MRTFEGIKVVDFTQAISGPFATYQLALQGADVIKIETPEVGDQTRQMTPLDEEFTAAGYSAYFMAANAGKRSVTLNLKHPDARDVIHRLVRGADIVVENFKAGTMTRLGFGYDDLKEINPRLIYCAITGFGQTGPRAKAAAYDPTVQAASGIMAINGTSDTGPMRVGPLICDMTSAFSAAFAIAGMLFKRERTGEGAYLDLSMQDVSVGVLSASLVQAAHGQHPKPMGNRSSSNEPMGDIFPTKQGDIILLPAREEHCAKIWPLIGRSDLVSDARFVSRAKRLENEEECLVALRAGLESETAKTWEKKFSGAGVPAAAVLTLPEVLSDEQLAHRGTIRSMPSNVSGRDTLYFNTPFKISGEETGPDCPPPLVGDHTDSILSDLGYSSSEISGFRKSGAI